MSDSYIHMENLNHWLATGERGISSEAIASELSGINILKPIWATTYPHDPSDFYRCLQLLDAVPEFKLRLNEMKKVHPVWAELVENWDELERLYKEEYLTGKCPRLYKRMSEIIESETAQMKMF